jgi:ubiquinone biosynthesis protein
MARRQRRKFTDEYKAEVVALVRSFGKGIAAISRDLDLTETAVREWVQRADVAETRRFAADQFAERLRPGSVRDAVADEFTTLMPVLRRLPRHIDRISAALESGRLSVNMRVFADDRDRQYVTVWCTGSCSRSLQP